MPALLPPPHGPEVEVRRAVAQRLPVVLLDELAAVPAWEVRWEAAQRAPAPLARRLLADDEAEVRDAARARLEMLDTEARHG